MDNTLRSQECLKLSRQIEDLERRMFSLTHLHLSLIVLDTKLDLYLLRLFVVVKKHDIHIKLKSYKLELLGELIV